MDSEILQGFEQFQDVTENTAGSVTHTRKILARMLDAALNLAALQQNQQNQQNQ